MLNSGAIMSAAILLNVLNPKMNSTEKLDFLTGYLQVKLDCLHFLLLLLIPVLFCLPLQMRLINNFDITNSGWLVVSSSAPTNPYSFPSGRQLIVTTPWPITWKRRAFSPRDLGFGIAWTFTSRYEFSLTHQLSYTKLHAVWKCFLFSSNF